MISLDDGLFPRKTLHIVQPRGKSRRRGIGQYLCQLWIGLSGTGLALGGNIQPAQKHDGHYLSDVDYTDTTKVFFHIIKLILAMTFQLGAGFCSGSRRAQLQLKAIHGRVFLFGELGRGECQRAAGEGAGERVVSHAGAG